MHTLVKITKDEDGIKVNEPKWHWIMHVDAMRTLCTGEVFGYGEGKAQYKTKTVKRGGIDCPKCLALIKIFKSIKL